MIVYIINGCLSSQIQKIHIPFFIVNGILTGSFIDDEVVWYNSQEIIGFRIFTVPVEDIVYGFSMILSPLLLLNIFRKKTV
jgi:lycopene cyclase domain-containing protein